MQALASRSTGETAEKSAALARTATLVRQLMETLGYTTPASMVDVYLRTIEDAPNDREELAFQRVRLRSIGAEEKLLAEEGGTMSDLEFAKRLGVQSRSTVKNYREQNKILAIAKGERNFRYPAWQIYNKKLLPGLGETLAVLTRQSIDPFSIVIFFLTPAEALEDERPLDLLRRNEVDAVVVCAQHYGDRR